MHEDEAPAPVGRVAVILLARSAIAAAPIGEMQALAASIARASPTMVGLAAFSEQGSPSLRDALSMAAASDTTEIRIVPLMVPVEPSFKVWMRKSVARWRKSWPNPHLPVRVSDGPEPRSEILANVLDALVQASASGELVAGTARVPAEGSLVPGQKHRILVCAGGPCNDAGSAVIWGHLRNEQDRLKLRVAGDGTMTCKTTCLGPCNLAPVLQVWPEGTFYGGVTEAAIDRIVSEHLLGGRIVEDFAYAPTGRKQRLRSAGPVSSTEGD